MKTKRAFKISALLTGAVVFNLIFWEENLGINLFLFSLLLIMMTAFFHSEAKKSRGTIISSIGIIVTGVFVIYHNSSMAKFTLMASIFMLVGFTNELRLKSIIYAIPTSISSYILVPKSMLKSIKIFGFTSARFRPYWRVIKLALIPILVLLVFYSIFLIANPVFAEMSDKMWSKIGEWIDVIFKNISFLRILFFMQGITIVAWIIYKSDFHFFARKEGEQSDNIFRSRIIRTPFQKFKTLGLKNEYRSALMLIIMVNLLLFIVNTIDIIWVWFNFKYDKNVNLSQFVHEGTYLLILSILLSMGILFYFFRKNLNFYVNRKRLILFSGIWIAQNLILVISVAIRNFHYIQYYGLAYKRIGVFVFLTMTVIGLCTLYLKIRDKKSVYQLLRRNSWSLYAILILISAINWDGVIVKHNISHRYRENIDVNFLLTLSDKTLPILDQNRELLFPEETRITRINEAILNRRISNFLQRKEETSWYSWNLLEDNAETYFHDKKR